MAARINDNRPYYVTSRIADILGETGKTIAGARLILLGMGFKRNIGDTRNSPAVRVAELLAAKGAHITYSDRHVPQVTIGGGALAGVELDEETLKRNDAAVVLVDHSYYDLEYIVQHSNLVIDTQNATHALGPREVVRSI